MFTATIISVVFFVLLGVVKRIVRGCPADQVESKKYIDEEEKCPECGAQWQGDDIFEHFMKMKADGDSYYKDKTKEEIKEVAGMYGWTEESPKYFRHLIGVELAWNHPNHYDGVSYWMCPGCKATWNRFTGQREEIPPNPNVKLEEKS